MQNQIIFFVAVIIGALGCGLSSDNPDYGDCNNPENVYLKTFNLQESSLTYMPSDTLETLQFESQYGDTLRFLNYHLTDDSIKSNLDLICSEHFLLGLYNNYHSYYLLQEQEAFYSTELPDQSTLDIKLLAKVIHRKEKGIYDLQQVTLSNGLQEHYGTQTIVPFIHEGEVEEQYAHPLSTNSPENTILNSKAFIGVYKSNTDLGTIYVHPIDGLVAFELERGSIYTKI